MNDHIFEFVDFSWESCYLKSHLYVFVSISVFVFTSSCPSIAGGGPLRFIYSPHECRPALWVHYAAGLVWKASLRGPGRSAQRCQCFPASLTQNDPKMRSRMLEKQLDYCWHRLLNRTDWKQTEAFSCWWQISSWRKVLRFQFELFPHRNTFHSWFKQTVMTRTLLWVKHLWFLSFDSF